MRMFIENVVTEFYAVATVDTMIGYHFRKIAEIEGDNILLPPMEAFKNHIPRITSFWEQQLTGKSSVKIEKPFSLIPIHQKLQIRRGEVGRWITLFFDTLNHTANRDLEPEQAQLIDKWREKLLEFERMFTNSKTLFDPDQG